MNRRRIILLSAAILLPVLWMALASFVWARGTQTPYSPLAWYNATQWWQANWWCKLWLVLGAALPTILVVMILVSGFRLMWGWSYLGQPGQNLRRPSSRPAPAMRAVTNTLGDSQHRLATIAEAQAAWSGKNGIAVGEAYDPLIEKGRYLPRDPATWGRGGKAPLMIDNFEDAPTHVRGVIAPPGAGKTQIIGSYMFTWRGSCVVHDPAAQLAPLFTDVRQRMGHRVFHLRPGLPGPNVLEHILDAIEKGDPTVDTKILEIVERICGHIPTIDEAKGNSFFFQVGSAQLVACLLYNLLYSNEFSREEKTLIPFRVPLSMPGPDLRKFLKKVYEDSPSTRAKLLAGPMVELIDETFDGISKGADQMTSWLTIPQYAEMVAGSAFPCDAILDGKTDVFLSIPLDVLDHTPAISRCLLGALLHAVYSADRFDGYVPFFIDETKALGYLQALKSARDIGRKYGVILCLFYQHKNQIAEQWGHQGAVDDWIGDMAWVAYAGISDIGSAEYVSKSIGEIPVLSWTEGDNTGTTNRQFFTRSRSWNKNYAERIRRLLTPEEIMGLRGDALIVLAKGMKPTIVGMPLMVPRPEFATQIKTRDRFVPTGGVRNGQLQRTTRPRRNHAGGIG